MKQNSKIMDTKQCRKNDTTPINDDAEQQPDCSGDYSIELMPDQFAFTEDGNDQQAMKRTRHTNKEKERKDRIKNDIQEIRSLLPPLYTSDKKQTHHELLQNAIKFIRVLIAENKELTSCQDRSNDLEHDKLRKESEELMIKNKQYKNFLEAVGIPESMDLSQVEVSWKLRDVASNSEACTVDSDDSMPTESHITGDSSETCVPVTSNESQAKEEDNISVTEQSNMKEADESNDVAEIFNMDQGVYTSADDAVAESGIAPTSGDQSVSDVMHEASCSAAVVSSAESQQPVFMLPDSGTDQQAEMERATSSSRLPASQSNGNLSDISEPASDTECSDAPLLTVSRLTLENAFRQTSMLDVGTADGAHKTTPAVAVKADDQSRSVGLLHGHVVSISEEDGQRYMQMMQSVSYPAHLSSGPVEPMLGLSCSARFGAPSTCPISPNVSEPTTSSLGQMNNVMMLPSGQLVLVSPQLNANSNILQTSESGVAPMLSGGASGALALAPPARQDNSATCLQHPPQTGMFTTNFNLSGINSGLTLGAHAQAVGSMPTVTANNTLFVNPSMQYGVPQQPMTFISGGQPGNVLPLIQPSCPSVNHHLTVAQNQAMTVNMPQCPVTLNTLQQPAPQSQHPSALILPNGQIVPVVTQPNLLFPQQQCTPVTGGLLMPSVPTPSLNIIGNIQNQQSQLRFGSNLLPTSTIQPTQVITNIANIRTPSYGLLQNANQTNQQQFQLFGNSLQPIGNMNSGGILLSQPRQKDNFTIKNMATSLSGLALPQNPGQFTFLPGSCINTISSQHLNTSGMFGGSCSTTMSTAVPVLQAKPNPFGSTAALSNIPATLTAMLTPEGSIILAIPSCRDGELSAAGNNHTATSKAQKVTQRPLMPKPTSKLDAAGQLAASNTPLPSSKVCPSMITCDFGTPGAAASMTSSPMVPLTVNTTSNMDFGCILSGPSSTASSTDILAKATKSIFSISPYEHLSPRSSFNSAVNDNLLLFSSTGLTTRTDAMLAEGKSVPAAKPKRSKTKAKPVKKKSVKNTGCGLTSLPDICHHVVQPHETVATVELSPHHAIVDQLGNDEEVSDINDFSDLIRMEPMTPKAAMESELSSDLAIEKHEVTEVTDLTDDFIDSSEKGVVEIRSDLGSAEISHRTPESDFIKLKQEDQSEKSKETVSFSVLEVATSGTATTEISVTPKKSETSDITADILTIAVKDLPPTKKVEAALCREVGTSTERKRKKHKKQKTKADAESSLVKEGKQDQVSTGYKKPVSSSSDKPRIIGCGNYGVAEKMAVVTSSDNSATPGQDSFSSKDNLVALTKDPCSRFLFCQKETNASSKKLENGFQLNEGKMSEEATQTSRTDLHGQSHSKLGLGKKSRKRSHKSTGLIKPEMLPDMLTFTESELLDVVDKVENMMVTDERDTRKRSHEETSCQELTVAEGISVKKPRSDEKLAVETAKEIPPKTSDQLSWPLASTTTEISTGLTKDIVPEMPDYLPGFEIEEEEMVGFDVPGEFSSSNPSPDEANKESEASPVFTLELVVPDIAVRSPEQDLSEPVETRQLNCSQSHPGVLEEEVTVPEPAPSSLQSPSVNGQEQVIETDAECDLGTSSSVQLHTLSVACTSSQARHSGIVSLAKQVAPSKHQGYVSAGVQPKAGASKHMARNSQGNSCTESDTVTTANFNSSVQTTSPDTYSENIFSGKDHYLPSSKDLGLDFSFELDSKEKTSPCDVTSAYDWVITDTEPPTSTSLNISSPNQKQFDCQMESKCAPMKTCSDSDCSMSVQPCVQSSSVGCTSVTHTTSSHHTLSSCSSAYYASPAKTPTDSQLMPGYATRQLTPSSSHQNPTAFSGIVSSDAMSSLCRNSATTVSGKGSTCTTSAVVTPCHALVVTSSNFLVRPTSGVDRSPMSVTPNAPSCTALNHHKPASVPSSSVCSSATMKSGITTCSNNLSRSSCSQKSSESHAVRSVTLPLESTMSASMYHSSSATDRPDRPLCSKEGPMRSNPNYFGASSQMSSSSSCAIQGKSLDDAFHYPLPPYVLHAASRDYSQIGGSLSRFSSTGNTAMLSSTSCASDYNALARCSLYFSSPFTHDLGLDMTHQRMSPNQGLPSCSIEKHSSAKVGSAGSNRLSQDGAKSCHARQQDDGYSGFPGSLMLSHNVQDVAQCNSQFLEPHAANNHGLLAHNRDSGSATARGNQRLSTGMQGASASRSRSTARSPAAAANERPTSFALHPGGYTGTSVASSLASPPLHHHSALPDRHCLSQQLSYDLSFHAPAIQTFSPNLNGVGFDPPALNFSRDCGNTSSPQAHTKKAAKKQDEHTASAGSKMLLSHSKHQQSSAQQSHHSQTAKSSSGSSRSSRSSKKAVKTPAYDVDSNMFESRSVTPYFGLGNISPNVNLPPDGLAYVNFFSNTGRPLSSAAKTLHHRDPPAPMAHPFNSSLFSPSRTQNGLGLNFQTGFGMDHMGSTHITSSQMIIPHSGAISAHMHGFGFFPDISGSMVQRDALNNMSSMKFAPGAILPSQGTVEPSPLHHPQTAGSSMYNNRGQLPSHMLHDMGFNALLGHQHAAFDARSISGGMVHPPFGSHSHAASFGMGPLNFPVHNL